MAKVALRSSVRLEPVHVPQTDLKNYAALTCKRSALVAIGHFDPQKLSNARLKVIFIWVQQIPILDDRASRYSARQ